MGNLFNIINIPFGYLIRFFYAISNNYIIALLLFAIAIKLVLLPLAIKQQKNQIKQASLRPKEMAIRKRYAGRTDKVTQQKMQQEILDLYQRENFNPMGGCLPLLIQFPIIISLYQIVRNPLRYISGLSTETINQIFEKLKDLLPDMFSGSAGQASQITMINAMRSHPEAYANLVESVPELGNVLLPNFKTFGLDLSQIPSLTNFSWLILIPILTFVVSYLTTKITRRFAYQPETTAASDLSMKIMDLAMPLMSVYFCFKFEAAIGVYWIFQNVVSVLQTVLLARVMPLPKFTEEDFKAAEREYNARAGKKTKTKTRSLHRIDEEDEADGGQPGETPEQIEGAQDAEASEAAQPAEPEKPETARRPISPAPLKKDLPAKKSKKKK